MDLHVIIVAIMGCLPAIALYSTNSTLGYVVWGLLWIACQMMIWTRCVWTPHRCWPDFAFNQLFPLIIIGGAMALCHFAVESREIPLINIFK